MRKLFEFLIHGSILKTILFNLHYFGFKAIFKPRVIIAKNVKLDKMKGKVDCINKFGASNIGFFKNFGYPLKKGKTLFHNEGLLTIHSHLCLGYGCSLSIQQNARLEIGDATIGEFTMICVKTHIRIGYQVMISWDVQIMDSDFHKILNVDRIQINSPKPIEIGDECWICSRALALKGTVLPKYTILAANSFVSREFFEEHCVISNNLILKKGVYVKP